MALTVYKRGDFYWVRGSVGGRHLRHTLDTRNKEVAHRRAAELELRTGSGLASLTWPQLAERFLAGYAGTTRLRYGQLLRALEAHLGDRRHYVHEATSLDLEALLHRPPPRSPNTIRYEIGRLRVIFRWAVAHKAANDNPAAAIRPPKAVPSQTRPLDRAELAALEDAIAAIEREPSLVGRGEASALRARTWAMYQVLRSTGLRVSDLIQLRPEHVRQGFLHTQKTGSTVPIKLPQVTLDAIAAVPPTPAGYYFWTGDGFKGACDSVWRTFARLGRRAGLAGVHPHRLRDTFAVTLLSAGADLRLVSRLLGHSSIRTTEKHYAPWVDAFQRQADDAIAAAELLYSAGAPQPAPPAGKKNGVRTGRRRPK